MRFSFGANWADYVKKMYSEERVRISQAHLLRFLRVQDLRGKKFIDIGCGSGLHSLAAWRAQADEVISFDFDGEAVATTKHLRDRAGNPSNWRVLQGSILDPDFVKALPKAEVVYSWGVLHHTGNMWDAVRQAAKTLHPRGVLYLALYCKEVYVSPPYTYWVQVKRAYNRGSILKKKWMEWEYAWRNSIRDCLKKRENPFKHIKEYKQSRGMSYWHDVKDWLGGYPIEFAGNQETEVFAREQLGLELIHRKAGQGNTEYLFRPADICNYWDKVLKVTPMRTIGTNYYPVGGFAWRVELPSLEIGDREKFMLYENSSPVGWPSAPLSCIQYHGKGRYRVENSELIFSATDNSDPRINGKKYSFRPDFI
jgi:SAM-dependent methyltransferase